MPVRRIVLWTLLALAGLLIAVGVTTAATSLTSQRVGLQAEPLDAGVELAPRPRRDDRATPTPDASASPSPESDDDDERGHGRGGGDD